MSGVTTTLVVPCFNEAARLPAAAFRSHVEREPDTAFLFVNDGSTDGTNAVLAELCKHDGERLRTLTLDRNRGKAEAVRRGVLAALDGGAGVVGYWDADLATPLTEIRRFRNLLDERPELVGALGSRVQMLGTRIERQPLRHYLGRVFATFAGLVLAVGVYDTQCGAKLFRSGDRTRALFEEPFVSRWVFDVEIIARLKRMADTANGGGVSELPLIEVPLESWRDVGGSKLRPRHLAGTLVDLMRIRQRYG